MKKLYILLALVMSQAIAAKAQNFVATLSGNPLSTTGWTTSSVSSVSANTFVLTQPTTNQAGYIYYNTPANLTTCAQFTAQFEFQITNNSAPPADGLTFFYITNPPSAFVSGGGMGLPNNPNGLVLLFDTYDNNSTPANNPLISLRRFDGTGNYVEEGAFGFLTPDLYGQTWQTNGNWHSVILNYNNGVVTVAIDGNPPSMTANVPLNMTGYFGFTAGTGSLYSKHSLRNVSITGYLPPNPPTVTAPNITYCQYETATPLQVTGTSLLWFTSATGGTGSTIAPTPNTSVPNVTTYYVAEAGSNGCESVRKPITVTVFAKPNPPGGTLNYVYCINQTPQAFSLNGANIKWYTTPTGGTGSTIPPTYSTGGISNYTWYASQTVNGCESDRAPVTVSVGQKPAPPTVTTPVRYCTNEFPFALTALGQNLKWYSDPVGGLGSNVPPIPYVLAEDTLSWWVTQSSNGCESIRTKLDVYVYRKPAAAILSSVNEVCQFGTVDFSYFGTLLLNDPNDGYAWKAPFPAATFVSGSGQGPVTYRFDTAGNQVVRLQVSHYQCVSDPVYKTIKVKPAPDVATSLPMIGCMDKDIVLGLSRATQSIDSYQWDFGTATVIDGTYPGGPFTLHWPAPGKYIISVRATTDGCPSMMNYDTIDVRPAPDARFGVKNPKELCGGDTVDLFANTINANYLYHWTPELYFETNAIPETRAVVKQGAYIKLNVTDDAGCTATDSVKFDALPCCEVYMPTAFSPNGDAKNDAFRIISRGHQDISIFRVVNRWGQTVFETADAMQSWDGKSGGVPQDIGVYYYYVKYRCNNGKYYEQKGELSLIR